LRLQSASLSRQRKTLQQEWRGFDDEKERAVAEAEAHLLALAQGLAAGLGTGFPLTRFDDAAAAATEAPATARKTGATGQSLADTARGLASQLSKSLQGLTSPRPADAPSAAAAAEGGEAGASEGPGAVPEGSVVAASRVQRSEEQSRRRMQVLRAASEAIARREEAVGTREQAATRRERALEFAVSSVEHLAAREMTLRQSMEALKALAMHARARIKQGSQGARAMDASFAAETEAEARGVAPVPLQVLFDAFPRSLRSPAAGARPDSSAAATALEESFSVSPSQAATLAYLSLDLGVDALLQRILSGAAVNDLVRRAGPAGDDAPPSPGAGSVSSATGHLGASFAAPATPSRAFSGLLDTASPRRERKAPGSTGASFSSNNITNNNGAVQLGLALGLSRDALIKIASLPPLPPSTRLSLDDPRDVEAIRRLAGGTRALVEALNADCKSDEFWADHGDDSAAAAPAEGVDEAVDIDDLAASFSGGATGSQVVHPVTRLQFPSLAGAGDGSSAVAHSRTGAPPATPGPASRRDQAASVLGSPRGFGGASSIAGLSSPAAASTRGKAASVAPSPAVWINGPAGSVVPAASNLGSDAPGAQYAIAADRAEVLSQRAALLQREQMADQREAVLVRKEADLARRAALFFDSKGREAKAVADRRTRAVVFTSTLANATRDYMERAMAALEARLATTRTERTALAESASSAQEQRTSLEQTLAELRAERQSLSETQRQLSARLELAGVAEENAKVMLEDAERVMASARIDSQRLLQAVEAKTASANEAASRVLADCEAERAEARRTAERDGAEAAAARAAAEEAKTRAAQVLAQAEENGAKAAETLRTAAQDRAQSAAALEQAQAAAARAEVKDRELGRALDDARERERIAAELMGRASELEERVRKDRDALAEEQAGAEEYARKCMEAESKRVSREKADAEATIAAQEKTLKRKEQLLAERERSFQEGFDATVQDLGRRLQAATDAAERQGRLVEETTAALETTRADLRASSERAAATEASVATLSARVAELTHSLQAATESEATLRQAATETEAALRQEVQTITAERAQMRVELEAAYVQMQAPLADVRRHIEAVHAAEARAAEQTAALAEALEKGRAAEDERVQAVADRDAYRAAAEELEQALERTRAELSAEAHRLSGLLDAVSAQQAAVVREAEDDEARVKEAEAKAATLEESLQVAQSVCADAEKALAETAADLESVRAELSTVSLKERKLEHSLQQAHEQASALQKRVAALEQDLEATADDVTSARTAARSSSEALAEVRAELARTAEALARAEASERTLRHETALLGQDKAALEQRHAAQVGALERALATLKSTAEVAQTTLVDRENAMRKESERLAAVEGTLAGASVEKLALQRLLDSAVAEGNRVRADAAADRERLVQEAQAARAAAEAARESLAQLEQLREQVQQQSAELGALRDTARVAAEVRVQLTTTSKELSDVRGQLRTAESILEVEKAAATAQITSLKHTLSKAEETAASLREQLSSLELQHQMALESDAAKDARIAELLDEAETLDVPSRNAVARDIAGLEARCAVLSEQVHELEVEKHSLLEVVAEAQTNNFTHTTRQSDLIQSTEALMQDVADARASLEDAQAREAKAVQALDEQRATFEARMKHHAAASFVRLAEKAAAQGRRKAMHDTLTAWLRALVDDQKQRLAKALSRHEELEDEVTALREALAGVETQAQRDRQDAETSRRIAAEGDQAHGASAAASKQEQERLLALVENERTVREAAVAEERTRAEAALEASEKAAVERIAQAEVHMGAQIEAATRAHAAERAELEASIAALRAHIERLEAQITAARSSSRGASTGATPNHSAAVDTLVATPMSAPGEAAPEGFTGIRGGTPDTGVSRPPGSGVRKGGAENGELFVSPSPLHPRTQRGVGRGIRSGSSGKEELDFSLSPDMPGTPTSVARRRAGINMLSADAAAEEHAGEDMGAGLESLQLGAVTADNTITALDTSAPTFDEAASSSSTALRDMSGSPVHSSADASAPVHHHPTITCRTTAADDADMPVPSPSSPAMAATVDSMTMPSPPLVMAPQLPSPPGAISPSSPVMHNIANDSSMPELRMGRQHEKIFTSPEAFTSEVVNAVLMKGSMATAAAAVATQLSKTPRSMSPPRALGNHEMIEPTHVVNATVRSMTFHSSDGSLSMNVPLSPSIEPSKVVGFSPCSSRRPSVMNMSFTQQQQQHLGISHPPSLLSPPPLPVPPPPPSGPRSPEINVASIAAGLRDTLVPKAVAFSTPSRNGSTGLSASPRLEPPHYIICSICGQPIQAAQISSHTPACYDSAKHARGKAAGSTAGSFIFSPGSASASAANSRRGSVIAPPPPPPPTHLPGFGSDAPLAADKSDRKGQLAIVAPATPKHGASAASASSPAPYNNNNSIGRSFSFAGIFGGSASKPGSRRNSFTLATGEEAGSAEDAGASMAVMEAISAAAAFAPATSSTPAAGGAARSGRGGAQSHGPVAAHGGASGSNGLLGFFKSKKGHGRDAVPHAAAPAVPVDAGAGPTSAVALAEAASVDVTFRPDSGMSNPMDGPRHLLGGGVAPSGDTRSVGSPSSVHSFSAEGHENSLERTHATDSSLDTTQSSVNSVASILSPGMWNAEVARIQKDELKKFNRNGSKRRLSVEFQKEDIGHSSSHQTL
jgi:chromosome segregation ATPase